MQTNINNKIEWIRNFFFVSRKNGADKIGVTANYLCQLEAGVKAPRLRALCKFSAAYGIPLDVLYSDERIFLLFAKYSLQGTTQSRYLTGGSARQIFHVMFKLSLVAAMVVIIKSTTRRLSSKDTFSQVSR